MTKSGYLGLAQVDCGFYRTSNKAVLFRMTVFHGTHMTLDYRGGSVCFFEEKTEYLANR